MMRMRISVKIIVIIFITKAIKKKKKNQKKRYRKNVYDTVGQKNRNTSKENLKRCQGKHEKREKMEKGSEEKGIQKRGRCNSENVIRQKFWRVMRSGILRKSCRRQSRFWRAGAWPWRALIRPEKFTHEFFP